jgi:N-acetylmuramoyl-L-alanine amidase
MAKKIYLSPSDQSANKYAYGGTTEEKVCEQIADACAAALKRCGFEVKNNKTSSMKNRVAESNKWGADLHVPIHTNAFNKKTTGTRIFCWSKTGAGYKASKAIYDVLAPLTPGTSENVSVNKTLYEVRVPTAPTAYIEVDFHDVDSVAKWLINNTEGIGETIAKGICNHFGLVFVEKEKPVEEEKSGVLYRVQVGAYTNKTNALAMQQKLMLDGYNAVIV